MKTLNTTFKLTYLQYTLLKLNDKVGLYGIGGGYTYCRIVSRGALNYITAFTLMHFFII
jgi:hypothetical protein